MSIHYETKCADQIIQNSQSNDFILIIVKTPEQQLPSCFQVLPPSNAWNTHGPLKPEQTTSSWDFKHPISENSIFVTPIQKTQSNTKNFVISDTTYLKRCAKSSKKKKRKHYKKKNE